MTDFSGGILGFERKSERLLFDLRWSCITSFVLRIGFSFDTPRIKSRLLVFLSVLIFLCHAKQVLVMRFWHEINYRY